MAFLDGVSRSSLFRGRSTKRARGPSGGWGMGARKTWWISLIVFLVRPAIAQADEIEEAKAAETREAIDSVTTRDAEAGAALARGIALLEERQPERAIAELETAKRLLPKASEASRYLCFAHLSMDEKGKGFEECQRAINLEENNPNRVALALALLQATDPSGLSHARQLTEIASAQGSLPGLAVLCQICATLEDTSGTTDCSAKLLERAPTASETYVFAALAALYREERSEALRLLDEADARGADRTMTDALRTEVRERPESSRGFWFKVGVVVLGWPCLLGLVSLLGLVLSKMTEKYAHEMPARRTGSAHGKTAWVRRCYRLVLWLACLTFYLSLPLMIVSVLALTCAVVYAAFAVGRIPIGIIFLLLTACAVTVFSTVKSLFTRRRFEAPGEELDLEAHPKLRALLDEVAEKLGTRPVDVVYVTPRTELAVFEDSGVTRSLRGKSTKRCLIVGVAVLDDFRLVDFKAVLAHEYGHFVNADTAGGDFALAVRRSIGKLALDLAQGGAAAWYNPAWLMLVAFYKIFLRISQGASRLQEILADRWSAFAYGAAAFEGGLTHVIRRSIVFAKIANARIEDAVAAKRPIVNLYRTKTTPEIAWKDVDAAVEEELAHPPSPTDSHPPPSVRFALVRKLVTEVKPVDDDAMAWDVFSERKELERRMTRELLGEVEGAMGIYTLVKRDKRPGRSAD